MRTLLCAVAVLAFSISALKAEDKPAEAPKAHVKAELPKPDADGWITLFNGKDLTGWDGDPKIWSVVDGYISGKVDKQGFNTFLIFDHPFSDFILEAKWILVEEKGNSGIQYRSKVFDEKKWIVGGYQADIGKGYHGALYEEKGKRGIIFKSADAAKTVKLADWNQYVITAKGNTLKQELNGVVSGEFTDADEAQRKTEGVIALQYHAPGSFEVRFKDIRIKPLK